MNLGYRYQWNLFLNHGLKHTLWGGTLGIRLIFWFLLVAVDVFCSGFWGSVGKAVSWWVNWVLFSGGLFKNKTQGLQSRETVFKNQTVVFLYIYIYTYIFQMIWKHISDALICKSYMNFCKELCVLLLLKNICYITVRFFLNALKKKQHDLYTISISHQKRTRFTANN